MTPTTDHVGLDRGDTGVREAEHWALTVLADSGLLASGVVACTHLLRIPVPHVAVSVALREGTSGALPAVPPEYADAAGLAREEHRSRLGGRAFAYPGRDACVGSMTVGEILERSAITRVTVLGGPAPGDGTVVDTRDHVRPQWMNGELTLVTLPAPGGRLAPFEMPEEIPCCSLHA